MIHKYKPLLALIAIIFLYNGCIKEIPFENNKTFNRISISGQFTNRPLTGDVTQDIDYHVIEIAEIPNENSESQANGDPIENATVQVRDDQGKTFDFAYIGMGKYRTDAIGEIGKSYKLEVTIGDHTYESDFHTILPNAPIDSIRPALGSKSFISSNGTVSNRRIVDLVVNTKIFDGQNPLNVIYRLKGEHEFKEVDDRIAPDLRTCFIKQNFDFGRINAFSGEDYPEFQLREIILHTQDYDYRFANNFSYLVEQFSVDNQTIKYWNTIKKITSEEQSLFDPPPGRFENNIKCTSHPDEAPFGYFTVASYTSKRIFTSALKLGVPMVNFCTGFGTRRPRECIDCRLFPNSTTVRPSYWVF